MNKFLQYIIVAIFFLQIISCNYFQTEEQKEPLARVNDTYLYKEDVLNLMPENLPAEDSAIFVNNYIKNWAKEQLLLDQAKINLPENKQQEFNKLVKDYKSALYTESYKDLILSGRLDTLLTEEELLSYYNKYTENFKLNQDLVKFRYIYLNKKFPELDKIKQQFLRFNQEDRENLETETLKFKAYSLNDSVWVTSKDFFNQIPLLKNEAQKDLLKEGNFLQQADSLGVYLVKINDVLFRNDNAPFNYAKPTIKQILLNRKKIKLSKDFEKEITKDALKNNKFEIYN